MRAKANATPICDYAIEGYSKSKDRKIMHENSNLLGEKIFGENINFFLGELAVHYSGNQPKRGKFHALLFGSAW